jgi:hypothetical protein
MDITALEEKIKSYMKKSIRRNVNNSSDKN